MDFTGRLEVRYTETLPGPNCLVAQVRTQPHRIVSVPKTGGPPVFIETKAVEDCAFATQHSLDSGLRN